MNPEAGSSPGTDRAVSDLLGFALTLAIVLASVTVVFSFGVGALEDVQQSHQSENAESTFVHIATKFQELGPDSAPYRAGELSVAPGSLGITDGGELNVTVVTPTGNHSKVFDLGSLDYSRGETRISIEGGGIFRDDRGNVVGLSDPALDCTDERALVPVMSLTATANASVSADLVTVTGRHRSTTLWYPFNRTGADTAGSATAVTVEVTSRNGEAWSRYLDRADGWVDPDGDGTYVCSTERVYVRHVEIGIRLI